MDQLLREAGAAALPQLALAVRDALSPGRGGYLEAEAGNLAQAVRYASAICLDRRSKEQIKESGRVADLLDKASPPTWLAPFLDSPAEAEARILAGEAKLLLAVGMLGTHGGKVPDNRLELGAMVPPAAVTEQTADLLGVHSDSVTLSHPLSGSRNAAQNAQMRFLCLGVSWEGGAPVALAAILAADGPARDALLAGFRAEAQAALLRIGAACARRLAGAVPTAVGGYRSQVLFPVDGGYVALAPLYSYGMSAELIARLSQRRYPKEGLRQRIDSRTVHVGGTKPQNTGLLATYAAGKFPRLVGLPMLPRVDRAETVVRLFQQGVLRLDSGRVSPEAFAEFERAAYQRDRFPNARHQERLEGAWRGLAADALTNLTTIHDADVAHRAEHGTRLAIGDAADGPSRAIALILGLLPNEASEVELRDLARGVARRLGQFLGGRKIALAEGTRTMVIDDDLHAHLVEAALDVIREHL